MNAIDVQSVCKTYSAFKLNNISFTLPLGQIMGLVGKNGAGKTTLLQIIIGGINADCGEILIRNMTNKNFMIRQEIGVVFDTMPCPKTWTPIAIEKRLGQFYPLWNSELYYNLLDNFGIDKEKTIDAMSKGMKVKLMIAFACSYDAKLLILDEPTVGIDPISRHELLNYFKHYVSDKEHSILFSTHIVSDLEKIADKVGFMVNGELRYLIEPQILNDYCIASTELANTDTFSDKSVASNVSNDAFHFLIKRENLSDYSMLSTVPATLDNLLLLFEGGLQYA